MSNLGQEAVKLQILLNLHVLGAVKNKNVNQPMEIVLRKTGENSGVN